MRPFRTSRPARPESATESLLRRERPSPSEELVHRLALQVARSARPSTAPRRLAMAAAVSFATLAAAGTLGGIGYAASSVNRAASAVRTAVAPVKLKTTQALRSAQSKSSNASGPVANKENDNGKGNKDDKGDKGDKGDKHDPDDDQYKPGKGCGDKNHVHFKEGECKKLK